MKEIVKRHEQNYRRAVSYGKRIQFITDDNVLYIFYDLTWYDYPIYSHREHRKDNNKSIDKPGGLIRSDSRNFNLPTQIKKEIFDEYGGYYMADEKVNIVEKEKQNYTIVKPDVGDIYPLREP